MATLPVRCTCGRWFRNMGELETHIWRNSSTPPMHTPDKSNAHTKKELKKEVKCPQD